MKKKMLSKEALAALYKKDGQPESESAVNAEDGVTDDQTTETPEVGGEETTETTASAESGGVDTEELSTKLESLTATVAELESKVLELETANKELEESKTELESKLNVFDKLKSVVADQTTRMRTAIDMAELNMGEFSAEDVLAEFNKAESSFMKSMPVGGVTPEETGDAAEAKAINTTTDEAAYASLGFN